MYERLRGYKLLYRSFRKIDLLITLGSRPVAIHDITRHPVRLAALAHVHCHLVLPIFEFFFESRYAFLEKLTIMRELVVFPDLGEKFSLRKNEFLFVAAVSRRTGKRRDGRSQREESTTTTCDTLTRDRCKPGAALALSEAVEHTKMVTRKAPCFAGERTIGINRGGWLLER